MEDSDIETEETSVHWSNLVDEVANRFTGTVRKNIEKEGGDVVSRIITVCTDLEEQGFNFSNNPDKLKSQMFNAVAHKKGVGKNHASKYNHRPHLDDKVKGGGINNHRRHSRTTENQRRVDRKSSQI